MSPNSPYRRRRPAPEPSAASRRRRKRRERDRRRRGRRTVLLAVFVAVPAVVLAVAAVGGTVAFGSSCNLNALRPVAVGENSFVYASDGSLLGAIPAERNRTPVSSGAISPWLGKATVAFAIHGLIFEADTGVRLRSAGIGPSSEPSAA